MNIHTHLLSFVMVTIILFLTYLNFDSYVEGDDSITDTAEETG